MTDTLTLPEAQDLVKEASETLDAGMGWLREIGAMLAVVDVNTPAASVQQLHGFVNEIGLLADKWWKVAT